MKTAKDRLLKIPKSPGVYFFKNTGGEIIYIGKAVNLNARVKSYFSQKLYGLKAVVIPEIAKIDYKIADTEIDALILESQYIKKHRPKYNVMLKDDKNYFYVVISPHPSRIAQGANPQLSLKGEGPKFPKIFITHQPFKIRNGLSFPRKRESRFDLGLDPRLHGDDKGKGGDDKWDYSDLFYMGPYTDGTALKTTLRFLRKIFPYCTCKSQHKLPCLKSHMGLCLGICCLKQEDESRPLLCHSRPPFCHSRPVSQYGINSGGNPDSMNAGLDPRLRGDPSERFVRADDRREIRNDRENNNVDKKENTVKTYKKNIKSIVDILSGKKKSILVKLEREMKAAAKKENFEKAAEMRNKISALKNIFEHKINGGASPILPRIDVLRWKGAKSKLSEIFGKKIGRIEFYDISNIQGQLATGSMVVFDNGKIDKNQYRKFKIKTVERPDDPAMMKEVLERRLGHTEWPMPDLIIVDGGITQLNAARDVLARFCHSSSSLCHYRESGNPEIASSLAMTRDLDPRFHGDDKEGCGDDRGDSRDNRKRVKIASLAKNPDRLFCLTSDVKQIKQIALKDLPENVRLLLQNLRDEAHRFAIGYHRKLRSKKLKREFK